MKIAIGPVFDEFGGMSRHILGIKKFSSHKVVEVPSKFVRIALGKGGRRIWLYEKFMNKIGLGHYDIVHSHVDPWFTNLCLSSKRSGCKWIHTYHTLYFEEDYPGGLHPWYKEINKTLIDVAPKADVKISISKWLHDYLSESYEIQTEIIPNGFDLEKCDNANPNRFLKKCALSDFVFFGGYIDPVKNPQLFARLAMQIPEVNFIMIGRILSTIRFIKEYGATLPKNLFLMNEMKHEDTLDAISACKAFVMTSKHEGIPTTLLEAMGMSKPVVVPSHSGCKEVVHSSKYGFLYEPGSLDDLVEQTRQALVSKHAGKRARERVSRKYDWKILAKRIDSIYESFR